MFESLNEMQLSTSILFIWEFSVRCYILRIISVIKKNKLTKIKNKALYENETIRLRKML